MARVTLYKRLQTRSKLAKEKFRASRREYRLALLAGSNGAEMSRNGKNIGLSSQEFSCLVHVYSFPTYSHDCWNCLLLFKGTSGVFVSKLEKLNNHITRRIREIILIILINEEEYYHL